MDPAPLLATSLKFTDSQAGLAASEQNCRLLAIASRCPVPGSTTVKVPTRASPMGRVFSTAWSPEAWMSGRRVLWMV